MSDPSLTPADPSQRAMSQRAQQPEPADLPQPSTPPPQAGGMGAQPQAQMGPEDETEQISQMVGIVKPWETVEFYLDNWEYRVWEGWIGRGKEGDRRADLLGDVLKQYDNNAVVTKGPSQSDPNTITYSFKFSLGGSPDGVVDAVTKINEAFLALENYQVRSGKMYAIVTYADGTEDVKDLTDQFRDSSGRPKGIDINDAVELGLRAITEEHAPESQWQRPMTCPECGEKLPPNNDEIAKHYADFHPDADIGRVYREESELCLACGKPKDSPNHLANDDPNAAPFNHKFQPPNMGGKEPWRRQALWTPGYQAVPHAMDSTARQEEISRPPSASPHASPKPISKPSEDENDTLPKVEKMLREVEDLVSEHQFARYVKQLLDDIEGLADGIIKEEEAKHPYNPWAVSPENQPKKPQPFDLRYSPDTQPDIPESEMSDRARRLYQKYRPIPDEYGTGT